MKSFGQDDWFTGRILNSLSPEYEAAVLTTGFVALLLLIIIIIVVV